MNQDQEIQINSQNIPPNTNTTLQPTQPKKLNTILFFFTGIVIGIMSTLEYQKIFKTQNILEANISYPTPQTTLPTTTPAMPTTTATPSLVSPSPTLDSSITWREFINPKIGYSIKYPVYNGLGRIICNDESDALYITNGVLDDPTTLDSCPRDGRYNIEIITKDSEYTDSDEYTIQSSQLIVDGTAATKTIHNLKKDINGPIPDWFITIRFNKDGIYYEAFTGTKKMENLLEQMISTFKFPL